MDTTRHDDLNTLAETLREVFCGLYGDTTPGVWVPWWVPWWVWEALQLGSYFHMGSVQSAAIIARGHKFLERPALWPTVHAAYQLGGEDASSALLDALCREVGS